MKNRKPKKKTQRYVEQQELAEEIKLYKKNNIISEKLGNILIKIATRYCTKPNFSNYSYKDDFIAEAVSRMVEQLHKVDLNHPDSNPFSYLTQMCHFKFIAKLNNEKRYQLTKIKIKEHYINEFELSEGVRINKNEDDLDALEQYDKNDSFDEEISEDPITE